MTGSESWPGEFELGDKWSFCLTAARMAAGNGVTKAALGACVCRGQSHNQGGQWTRPRAGKGCGSCKSLVAEIVIMVLRR